MADNQALTEIIRRAAQANAEFYRGWMDLSLKYVRGLSEIFGGLPEAVAPIQEMDAGIGALVLEGDAGKPVRGSFLVSNDLDRATSCRFVASDFKDPHGGSAKPTVTFEPVSVELGPGEQRVVHVSIHVDDALTPGVGYAGEISIGGMEGFAVPVVLRRQHPIDDESAAAATEVPAPDAPTMKPEPPAKRKPARKKSAARRPTR